MTQGGNVGATPVANAQHQIRFVNHILALLAIGP